MQAKRATAPTLGKQLTLAFKAHQETRGSVESLRSDKTKRTDSLGDTRLPHILNSRTRSTYLAVSCFPSSPLPQSRPSPPGSLTGGTSKEATSLLAMPPEPPHRGVCLIKMQI